MTDQETFKQTARILRQKAQELRSRGARYLVQGNREKAAQTFLESNRYRDLADQLDQFRGRYL